MERVVTLLELVRIEKPVATAMYTLVGAYLGSSVPALWAAEVMAAALIVGLITAFAFAINDYCDSALDAISRPNRPIPSGRISRAGARSLAWTLAAAAFLMSLVLSFDLTLFVLGMVVLSAAYSYCLKGTMLLGNSAIALLVAMVLIFGALVAGEITLAVQIGATLTFLYVLGQEILFNIEDDVDDLQAGLRTTANRLGRTRAVRLVQAILIVFIATTVLPWYLALTSIEYLIAVLVLTGLPTTALIILLSRSIAQPVITLTVRLSRVVWISSLVPMVLLK